MNTQTPLGRIEKAINMVSALCQPKGSEGSRNWTMSIPAQPDYDPDLIIADGLLAGKEAVNERATLLSQIRKKDEALRAAKEWAEKIAEDERVTGFVHQSDYALYCLLADCPVDFEAALSPAPQPDAAPADWNAAIEAAAKAIEGFDAAANSRLMKPFADAHVINAVYARDAAMAEHLRSLKRAASPLPADDVISRTAAIKVAEEMRDKHSSPTGDQYSQGVWDQSQRIIGKLRAAPAANLLRQSAPVEVPNGMSGYIDYLQSEILKRGGQIDDESGKVDWPASPPADAAGMPHEAVEQLTTHQEQCDFDGVMVKVSRQALDEVLEFIRAIPETKADAAVKALVEAGRELCVAANLAERLGGKDLRDDFKITVPFCDLKRLRDATLAQHGVK